MRLVCASANPDKVAEIAFILDGLVELLPRPAGVPAVVEDADTLEGNARLKATAVSRFARLPAVADDSGLFVDALDGRPGVHAAYFAGPQATYAENVAKLLAALDDVAPAARTASFVAVALVRWPDGREVIERGVVPGRIAAAPRGTGGFGYDSVFVPTEGDGRTFAEMDEATKHAISHRGRALRALAEALAGAPA